MRPPRLVVDGLAREIHPGEDYYAIVYEYMPSHGPALDVNAVQGLLDFLWRAGFCFMPLRIENWAGPGFLLDMCDIICPWHAGWSPVLYRRFVVRNLLV